MAKSITLLGSTGSIGTQSLDVARSQGYEVRTLAANSSVDKLLEQIEEFHPRYVAVADPAACQKLKGALAGRANAPKVLEGAEGIVTLAGMGEADVVLTLWWASPAWGPPSRRWKAAATWPWPTRKALSPAVIS